MIQKVVTLNARDFSSSGHEKEAAKWDYILTAIELRIILWNPWRMSLGGGNKLQVCQELAKCWTGFPALLWFGSATRVSHGVLFREGLTNVRHTQISFVWGNYVSKTPSVPFHLSGNTRKVIFNIFVLSAQLHLQHKHREKVRTCLLAVSVRAQTQSKPVLPTAFSLTMYLSKRCFFYFVL